MNDLSNPSTASHRQPAQQSSTKAGFTPQQTLILTLVTVLGIVLLLLAAWFVFSLGSSLRPAVSAAQPVGGDSVPNQSLLTAAPLSSTPTNDQPALPSNPVLTAPVTCAQQSSDVRQGTLLRVLEDGTLEVSLDGKTVQISFAGIQLSDAPLARELAAQRVRELTEGQTLILAKDVSDQDASGRLARYVFASASFINFELVRSGAAQTAPNAPDRACLSMLQQAEEMAREEKLGLWKPTPVPTRTFMPLVSLVPQSACDCSQRPICADFKSHDQAQQCFNACQDYSSLLDEDHNGIACEELP